MLKQTKELIKNYGKKLINGTITDASLHELLVSSAEKKALFKKYPASGYVEPTKVTDKNFGIMDGMKDFVLHLAPKIPITVLHEITARLIQLSPATIEKNTFMRQADIAKVFLAYELYAAPDAAEEHFSTMRMKREFPGPNDIGNLQRVILEPIILFFEENLKVGRRNSLAGFTEPMPQAPIASSSDSSALTPVIKHERMPSEPFPVAPRILPEMLAQMAAEKPVDTNASNKKEEAAEQALATIESLLAAHPISPRKSVPFQRHTSLNSYSAAPTELSSAVSSDGEANYSTAPASSTPIINERIASESAPIAPDLLTFSLAQMATAEPLNASTANKKAEVANYSVSPKKSLPFNRQTPINSNSTATKSSILTNKDVDANDIINESAIKRPMPTTTTTQVSTAATATSSAASQNIPEQPVTVVASTAKEQLTSSVTRPEAVKSAAAGAVPNRTTSMTSPTLPRAAQAAEPARSFDDANPTLSQLTTLCHDYARHLKPHVIAGNLASKKLDIVNEMIARLENSRVPNTTQRIRNMSGLLTENNKAILKEQRSGFGVKFLETLLNILTVGLYSKCTKNTFSFWKSHGEVLSDNLDNLTKDNSSLPIK